uniref:GYF domain-containing protein n=1 Tax=Anopheles maculatus TaxID=74869 RepID=A0A182SGM8_9DIPT
MRRRGEDVEAIESRRGGTEDTLSRNRADGSAAMATTGKGRGDTTGKGVNHVGGGSGSGSRAEEASLADINEANDHDDENQPSPGAIDSSHQKPPQRIKRQTVGKDGGNQISGSPPEPAGALSETVATVQPNSTKGISSSRESIESSVSSTISGTAPANAAAATIPEGGGGGDARQNSPSWQKGHEVSASAKNTPDHRVPSASGEIDHSDGAKHHPAQQPQHEKRNEPKKSPSSTSVDRMQEVADDMVAQLIMDDEFMATDGDPSVISSIATSSSGGLVGKSPVFGMAGAGVGGTSSGTAATTMASSGGLPMNMVLPKALQPMQQLFGNGNMSRVNPLLLSDPVAANRAAMAAAAAAGVNPMAQLHHLMGPPGPPRGSDIWYYCDPQGKVQGPFQAAEMTEWYRAGYFDESLSVRRECDEVYNTLGTLVALCGGMPFLNSAVIQPFKAPAGANGAKHSPQQQQLQQQQTNTSVSQGGQQKQQVAPGANGNTVMPSPNPQQQQSAGQQGSGQQQTAGASGGGGPNVVPSIHLLRQQSMVLQKLQNSDGWNLLSPEQQNMIITQHMNQLLSSDAATRIGMISPSAASLSGGS